MCPGHMAFVDLLEEANEGVYRYICTCGATADDVAHECFSIASAVAALLSRAKDRDACRAFYE